MLVVLSDLHLQYVVLVGLEGFGRHQVFSVLQVVGIDEASRIARY